MKPELVQWIEATLATHGWKLTSAPEAVKRRPWAAVWRFRTSAGLVYCKEPGRGAAYEGLLARTLAAQWPALVQVPLAVEEKRGWMLTVDSGVRMDALGWSLQRILSTWEVLLPRYAELQIASRDSCVSWLERGVPDRRLDMYPILLEDVIARTTDVSAEEKRAMRARLHALEAVAEELAASPAHPSLEHGDLHAANVLVDGAARWIFDWGDASVSHAFATLPVTRHHVLGALEGERRERAWRRLLDVYLEPWSALASRAELRRWADLASWVGTAGRALDFDHTLRGSEGTPEYAAWIGQVAVWLRRWRAHSAAFAR